MPGQPSARSSSRRAPRPPSPLTSFGCRRHGLRERRPDQDPDLQPNAQPRHRPLAVLRPTVLLPHAGHASDRARAPPPSCARTSREQIHGAAAAPSQPQPQPQQQLQQQPQSQQQRLQMHRHHRHRRRTTTTTPSPSSARGGRLIYIQAADSDLSSCWVAGGSRSTLASTSGSRTRRTACR